MHSSYCDQNIKQAIPLLRTEWYTVNVGFERGRMHGQADIIYRHVVSSESSNRKLKWEVTVMQPATTTTTSFRHSFDGTRTYICIVDTPCFAEGPRCVLETFEWIQQALTPSRRLPLYKALSYDRQFQKFTIIIFIYVKSSRSSGRGIWWSVRNRSLVEIQEPLLEESSTRFPYWAEC